MNKSSFRAGGALCAALCLVLHLTYLEAPAQFRLRSDAVGALGGTVSGAGRTLFAVAGQPHPLGTSSGAGHVLNPGFIPTLFGAPQACTPGDCPGAALFPVAAGGTLGQPIPGQDGSTIAIDIRLKQNPQPFTSFGFHLNVDPAHLTFVSAQAGDLTTGFVAVNANVLSPGLINCGGFGTTPVPANSNGALIRLNFTVTCNTPDRSEITLSNLIDGVAGLRGCCNIFECVEEAACVSDGDVSGDGTLTPGDAQCAFQIFLNGGNLPAGCDASEFECETVAADVNCDGTVTPSDALAIFQRFLQGLPPEECFAQAALNRSNAATVKPTVWMEQRAVVGLPATGQSELLKVAFKFEHAAGLAAFGLQLVYPSDRLDFVGVVRTDLTSKWQQLEGRVREPGIVIVGGFNTDVAQAHVSGEFFQAMFAFKNRTPEPVDFQVTQLQDDLEGALLKHDLAGVTAVPLSFNLYQSYPNPFGNGSGSQGAMIRFDLPGSEAVKVELSVYNLNGQLVRRLLSTDKSPGAYEVAWDGRDENSREVPSGVYWYRLKAGTFVASKRLSVVR